MVLTFLPLNLKFFSREPSVSLLRIPGPKLLVHVFSMYTVIGWAPALCTPVKFSVEIGTWPQLERKEKRSPDVTTRPLLDDWSKKELGTRHRPFLSHYKHVCNKTQT